MNKKSKKIVIFILLGVVIILILGKLLGIDLLYLPKKRTIRVLESVFPTCSYACGWGNCRTQSCSCHGVELVLYNDLPVDGIMKSICVGEILESE